MPVSTTENLLYRIPVDADARIIGDAEVVAEGLGLDDFELASTGLSMPLIGREYVVVKINNGEITTIAGGEDSRDVARAYVREGRAGERARARSMFQRRNGAFAPPGTVGEPAGMIVAISLSVGGDGERKDGGKGGRCRRRR